MLMLISSNTIEFQNLSEEVETELKEASIISMGTEIGEVKLGKISMLCDQVLSLLDTRLHFMIISSVGSTELHPILYLWLRRLLVS
jgi:hypothetical protein